MDTTLPGLMPMRILDPMSTSIPTGIMPPIITPIDWEVRRNKAPETGILVHACLSALPKGGV